MSSCRQCSIHKPFGRNNPHPDLSTWPRLPNVQNRLLLSNSKVERPKRKEQVPTAPQGEWSPPTSETYRSEVD